MKEGACLRLQKVRAVGNGKGDAARLTGGADGEGAAELRERDGELRVGALHARRRRALQRHRAAVALVVVIADGHLPLKQSACSYAVHGEPQPSNNVRLLDLQA